eukprot:3654013-Heterocapsa_arctica.AAC.1
MDAGSKYPGQRPDEGGQLHGVAVRQLIEGWARACSLVEEGAEEVEVAPTFSHYHEGPPFGLAMAAVGGSGAD